VILEVDCALALGPGEPHERNVATYGSYGKGRRLFGGLTSLCKRPNCPPGCGRRQPSSRRIGARAERPARRVAEPGVEALAARPAQPARRAEGPARCAPWGPGVASSQPPDWASRPWLGGRAWVDRLSEWNHNGSISTGGPRCRRPSP
jgi:hypothetical protein